MAKMKGVVLAGGKGTRLGELTKVTNKHLLPVGDWPMIYYPIKKLIGAEVTDIMIVTGTDHMGDFVRLLGSGKDLDCSLTYKVQDKAGGIAQALGLCETFVGNDNVCVILGDNIFEDRLDLGDFDRILGARIYLKMVDDPWRFGVAEVRKYPACNYVSDPLHTCEYVADIEEKPKEPKSKFAVTGIYIYDSRVFGIIKGLKPSERGELEITDVNKQFITPHNNMYHAYLSGYWTDAGTSRSLARANELVRMAPPKF
jgi:glucose-1-phosphate thymidylyltransferase